MKPLDYLKKIEENGYQAFIVGGYVRDYYLNIESTDIDITTNAKPDELENIFNVKSNYGGVKINDGIYHIDITTYRKESSYFNHTPRKIKYINNIKKDILRRDFTMNALLMNSNGEIIDLINAKEDINKKSIKVIGRVGRKFKEDPLRMIRALRFMITYNFKLDSKALTYILKHKDLIAKVSNTRKKEEIDRILLSDNVVEGLEFLNNFNILSTLGISYSNTVVKTNNLISMWAQMECMETFPFKKEDTLAINAIKKLLKNKSIDAYDIYKYGLNIVTASSAIMGIKQSVINNIYKTMNIIKNDSLAINGNDILRIIKCDKKNIKKIKEDLIYQLLSGNLSNDKNSLESYIKKNWK